MTSKRRMVVRIVRDFKLYNMYFTTDFELVIDALTIASSTFTLVPITSITKAVTGSQGAYEWAEPGDIVIISGGDYPITNSSNSGNLPNPIPNQTGSVNATIPEYIGIVDSNINARITAKSAYELFNRDVVVLSSESWDTPSAYIMRLFNDHIRLRNSTAYTNFYMFSSGTAYRNWSFKVEKPSTVNGSDLLVSIFKQTNTNVSFYAYYVDPTTKNVYFYLRVMSRSSSEEPSQFINLGNSLKYRNVDVYIRPYNFGEPNGLEMYQMYDKPEFDANGKPNVQTPEYRYFWRTTGGAIVTQFSSSTISKPVIYNSVIYDTYPTYNEETGSGLNPYIFDPTPLEVAESELADTPYQHEITVDYNLLTNTNTEERILLLGKLINFKYNNRTTGDRYDLNSSVTGFTITGDSDWVQVKIGNIRSTLSMVLDDI